MQLLRSTIYILLLAALALSPLAAQEGEQQDDRRIYVIREVRYEIDGRNRVEVLKRIIDIEQGKELAGREALDTYLEDKTQVIMNQRTLQSGEIEPSFERSDEKTYVDLTVRVEETWNLLLLPYGKYDSNEGLTLSLRGRDYNFLGSMERLALNFNYVTFKPEGKADSFALYTSFKYPFYTNGLEWLLDYSGNIDYKPDAPLEADSTLTLGLDVPVRNHTWKAELIQSYHLNPKGADDPDGYYFRTTARFGSGIPTGLMLPLSDELTYTPYLFTAFSYKPGDVLSEDRRGYELGLSHSLSAGRVDWMDNFRAGTKLSLSHTHKWNFTRARWLASVAGSYEYHNEWDWAGLSSRAGFFYSYGSVDDEAGDTVRGILDDRVVGDAGLYGNIDLPFRMWIWFMERWFEGHLSPFFDYALVSPEGSGGLTEAWYGTGLEAFAFADFARSLYLRISFGLDLRAMLEGGSLGAPAQRDGRPRYEIFVGIGHHY